MTHRAATTSEPEAAVAELAVTITEPLVTVNDRATAKSRARQAALPLLLLVAMLGAATEATATPDWEYGVDIGYLKPRSDELSQIYDGSVSFHLSGARRIAKPAGSIGIEIGYFRSTGDLTPAFFVHSAETKLQWIPIDLVARMELAQRRKLIPYIGLGFQLLHAKESFEYTIVEEGRSQSPNERWDPGVLFVLGVDRVWSRLRIEGTFSLVFAERRINAGDDNYAITGDDSFDAGSLGLRIGWRLP